ncbi:MAG TPA: hypothetical protein VF389_11705 [Woeseiaceae bacterium]
MVTCRDIIGAAFRQARVYGAGEDPSSEDAADGLFVLQSMYDGWVSTGAFGDFTEVYKTAAYTAKEGERVVTDGAPVITIPTTFSDGSDDYGGGTGTRRAPKELSVIQVVNRTAGTTETHIYYNGAWEELEGLTLNSPAPLAYYGKAGLAACLALEMADYFGSQVGMGVGRMAARFMAAFRDRRIASNDRGTADYY